MRRGHVKQWSLDANDNEGLQAQLYLPFRALPDNNLPTSVGVLVRSNGATGGGPGLSNSIRTVVAAESPLNVVSNLQTMNQVIAGLLACFIPAWRAAHVDPLVALRDE